MISRRFRSGTTTKLFLLSVIIAFVSITMSSAAMSQDILQVLRMGNAARGKEMLEADPSLATYVGGEKETPLHYAAYLGDMDLIKLLVELGADINARNDFNQNPMLYAAYEGKLGACEYLLEKGSDFDYQDTRGNTPLLFAARQNHPEVVKLLIEKGATVEVKGNNGATPLYHAAARGNFEILKMLEVEGAAIGTADDNGLVPVLAALNGGHREVVEYLISKGALNGFTKEQYNVLMHGAAAAGMDALVDLAVEKGADFTSKTEAERTILHSAVAGGSTALVSKALDEGIQVNNADMMGRTALHLAVADGDLELTEFLLEKGADPNLKTKDGKAPYSIADDACYDDIIAVLLKNGAKKTVPEPLPIKGRKGKKHVEVRYIANEGFVISGGGKKVMFDAFIDNPWNYTNTGERIFGLMCEKKRPFDGVDLNIASHNHVDHFHAEMILQYMRAAKDVIFVGNQLAIDDLTEAAGDTYREISNRVINFTPEWNTKVSKNIKGIETSFFGCNHAGSDGTPYLTLESIVDIDGIKFLHLADLAAESSEGYIRNALKDERIDIAFLDRFFMEDSIGALLIEEVIKPQYIIVMHLRDNEIDPTYEALIEQYPNLIVFHEQLERKYFK
ncbi:MAG: ankyrin repeat domain-containing protein [bacterium]|nr:MAG: ankyrin repeat domain-containing protein [bacterium]